MLEPTFPEALYTLGAGLVSRAGRPTPEGSLRLLKVAGYQPTRVKTTKIVRLERCIGLASTRLGAVGSMSGK